MSMPTPVGLCPSKVAKFCAIFDEGFMTLRSRLLQELVQNQEHCLATPVLPGSPARVKFSPDEAVRSSETVERKPAFKNAISLACCSSPNVESDLQAMTIKPEPVGITQDIPGKTQITLPHASADKKNEDRDEAFVTAVGPDTGKTIKFKVSDEEATRSLPPEECHLFSLASRSSMVGMPPITKWRLLIMKLMRPGARVVLSKVRYALHDCWAECLTQLRQEDTGARQEYSSALARVVTARQDAEKGSKSRTMDSLLMPTRNASVVHPDSNFVIAWTSLSLLVLLHDVVLLPFNVFFDPEANFSLDVLMWISSGFWVLDLILSFIIGRYINGIVEMRPKRIAISYTKSWFFFDFLLVFADVACAMWDAKMQEKNMENVRAIRCIRALRLIRLSKVSKLKLMLRHAVVMNSRAMLSLSQLLSLTLLYAVYIHVSACGWYGLGRAEDGGWAHECREKESVSACYLQAAHWTMSHLHGTTSYGRTYRSDYEWCAACLSLLIGFFLFAFFLARATDTVAHFTSTEKLQLRQWCAAYAKNRKLSSNLAHQLLRNIEAGEKEEDVVQRMHQEREILQMLPVSIQAEILEEVRRPMITSTRVFRDVGFISDRILSQLCFQATSSIVCLSGESVFLRGEIGAYWRIVDSGCLVFLDRLNRHGTSTTDLLTPEKMLGRISHSLSDNKPSSHGQSILVPIQNSIRATTRRQSCETIGSHSPHKFSVPPTLDVAEASQMVMHRRTSSMTPVPSVSPLSAPWETIVTHVQQGVAKTLQVGESISEMVLWSPWIHTGDLLATGDCTLLQMGVELLQLVLKVRNDTCLYVAKYAQRYVRQMNSVQFGVSDIFDFDGNEDDEVEDTIGDGHLVFLSHFKAEAGTEATLMQEALHKLLESEGRDEQDHHVFLDSENLTSLNLLRDEVINSRNLVLLLTPEVLSRPWCLVEIVTAMKYGVQIVPVDIQRPGLKFQFPDELFYKRLSAGGLLSEADTKIVSTEGITLKDIEDALRFTFTQIALPFSPHKSKGIREAELYDIMKRCLPRGGNLTSQPSLKLRSASLLKSKDIASSETPDDMLKGAAARPKETNVKLALL